MLKLMSRLRAIALGIGGLFLTPSCRDPGPPAPAQGPGPTAPASPTTMVEVAEPVAPPAADARSNELRQDPPGLTPEALHAAIPAMTYRARPPRTAAGQPQIPYEQLRLGLYDHATRTFVPVTPPVPSALGGLLDRRAERALVLAGDLVMGEIWLVQARRIDVSLFDLGELDGDEPADAVLQVVDVDAGQPKTDRIRVAVEAALAGPDAARVTLRQLGYEPKDTASLLVTAEGVRLTREHVSSDSLHLHVDASGAFVEVPPPKGVAIEAGGLRISERAAAGGRLAVDRPRRPKALLPLGPGHEQGHRHVARTPDGRFVMVFTVEAGCRELAYERHVLDRIDLAHDSVTRLSEAPVHAGAALGPDGSVYLDADGRVLRFPPDSTTAVADVRPGVRFATPDFDRDCSI